MLLTPHFSLRELTFSHTATRLGIANNPGPGMINRLRLLCVHILEPVREEFGPFSPSSGYRGPALNQIIGGSKNSQHTMGEAADFRPVGRDTQEVAEWIKKKLAFDQLILEYYDPETPRSGWIHCSYVTMDRRNEVLTKVLGQKGYIRGLPVR